MWFFYHECHECTHILNKKPDWTHLLMATETQNNTDKPLIHPWTLDTPFISQGRCSFTKTVKTGRARWWAGHPGCLEHWLTFNWYHMRQRLAEHRASSPFFWLNVSQTKQKKKTLVPDFLNVTVNVSRLHLEALWKALTDFILLHSGQLRHEGFVLKTERSQDEGWYKNQWGSSKATRKNSALACN